MTAPNRHVAEATRHIAQSYLTEYLNAGLYDIDQTGSYARDLALDLVAKAHVEYKQRGSLLVLTFDLSEPATPKA